MSRSSERGSALLVTLIIIAAITAGGATLFELQLQSTRSSGLVRTKMSSMYCAEAGLASARNIVAAHYADWNASLGQPTEPSWLSGIVHDLDADGIADFTLTLRDNADETAADDDPAHDNDLSVFVVATCTKYADAPSQVIELVRFNGGGNCYQAQLGGCGGNANAN